MKTLTTADAFTTPIRVPEDGVDLRRAITVEEPIQALANRTHHLDARLDVLEAKGTTTKIVPVSAALFHGSTVGASISTEYSGSVYKLKLDVQTAKQVSIPLNDYLPHGSTLTAIHALHSQGASGTPGDRDTLTFRAARMDFSSPGISYPTGGAPVSQEVDGTTASGTSPKVTAITGLSYVVDRSQDSIELVIASNNNPGSCFWYAIRLTYTGAG